MVAIFKVMINVMCKTVLCGKLCEVLFNGSCHCGLHFCLQWSIQLLADMTRAKSASITRSLIIDQCLTLAGRPDMGQEAARPQWI